MTSKMRTEYYEKVIDLIAENGFKGVSSKALANRLGITTFTFYNEFLSQTALYENCFEYVDYCFSEFLRTIAPVEGEDMQSYFNRAIGDFYSFLVKNRSKALYFDVYSTALLGGKSRKSLPRSVTTANEEAKKVGEIFHIQSDLSPVVIWSHAFDTTFSMAKRTIDGMFPDTEETKQAVISIVCNGLVGSLKTK